MIRFNSLETLGVAVAALSGKSDGRLSVRPGDAPDGPCGAFCARCDVDRERLVCLEQVHEAAIAFADPEDCGRGVTERLPRFPRTDGVVTASPGVPLAIFVADCVPVYLVDPVARAIGLLHAGREGTVKRIAEGGVRAMASAYGSCPVDIHAVIGPSAGVCCYEVCEEMAEACRVAGVPAKGRNLDLWAANKIQLESLGVPPGQICVSGICTICDGRFHSHRADANAGRNMALLSL
ncbi:MAG: multicopper polyphenol oxidase [Nitrospiraceae bacterium]|nr:multicopper polyphenol oxidase [Nitrospiraceae bacterium]